jgi:hypothetical protein
MEELRIKDFQINMPFPGGSINNLKMGYPLDTERLNGFPRGSRHNLDRTGVSTVECGSVLSTS